MKMNQKTISGIAAFVFVVALSVSSAYAHGGGFSEGHKKGGAGKDDKLAMMFAHKAHFIVENAAELGLGEDKVDAIKNLQLETKKMTIRQDAEIEITCLEAMTKLHAYPIDVDAVNKLVDQKYDLKKTETKNLVAAIAKLKGMLTKEQYDKLHTLWEAKEKEERA
jgi:Spy/CpxP family protein refolding chaperone